MSGTGNDVLLLVLALQIKHLFADFFLQSEFMLAGRSRYAHAGRALHVVIHGLGTFCILLVFGGSTLIALVISAAEMLIHFHIDWGKARLTEQGKLTPSDASFWHAVGVDQALHQATYLAIAAIFVMMVSG